MLLRRAVLTLLVAVPVFGQEIHLKTRNIDTRVSTPAPAARRTRISPGIRVHRIVQLDHAPGAEDLDNLVRAGAEVLGVVPDNAVVVSLPAGRSLPRTGLTWTAEIHPADKLSPALPASEVSDAIVEFHGDVLPAQQDAVLAAAGLTGSRPAILISSHVIVTGTHAQFAQLAEDDSVAYIFPADADLTNGGALMPCAGMLTVAGPVAQYANIVHGWDSENGVMRLNYVFGTLPSSQPARNVQSEVIRALNAWSQQANVVFQPSANISALRTLYIWFASGAHGDAYPFTPSSGVLAHTFYPAPINPESIAGDMHFNLNENWNIGGDIDIYSVALHEIGHAIGLGHSDKPGDVMYPYYRRGMVLSANDVGAAVSLYGPAVPSANGTLTTTTSATPAPTAGTAGTTPAPKPVTPLALTLNPPPASTQTKTVNVSGNVSGGGSPVQVQWQTDHAFSGSATVSNGIWTVPGIPLVTGSNTITVTAFDAGHASVSETATVILQAPASGASTPVSIHITSPASTVTTTNSTSMTMSGTASGGSGGVVRVTWETLAGASGSATGTGVWVASRIPLLQGTNTIVVRAYDANGASAWASLVVVRQ